MGKCRAEMETQNSHAACSWHGAAPTGGDGSDGTRTPEPAVVTPDLAGSSRQHHHQCPGLGTCKAAAGLSHSAVETDQPIRRNKVRCSLVTDF